ncbi:hypothetical protein PHYBLDRAFT_71053 [Phycomyces blakesleeanus NRRL 1555(-)]|uniref:Uncharacterized protein n=1 Tax=Phycomyces blakesleeanus (strain ATCC 8743b / DSM 1359 / FGSC 10004 / NBRC 33097 / NRRL 1555) TaxID=763407 RepID=A0A162PFZ9_PHYB8|nr:hypothetical protein PHYBLDRAFT_71053 [Phycomyces blakesleeanus NRRL 1555(-)]OAD65346.1 hypothetical protein PHYBLDRAFT_71053 [Phycomyces blakesleeanus NRRL 1555(-)]|eukprot:XP_018283386.1 hypothetical protein PHYBLDRAFT_71053 [Phycomyces blakesleeanus NRRL 1555(-)]
MDCYPSIADIQYSPPPTVPIALQKFSTMQKSMHSMLQAIQYNSTAVFCLLDVLSNELMTLIPITERDHIFAMLHAIRILAMHTCGRLNTACNNLAFKLSLPHKWLYQRPYRKSLLARVRRFFRSHTTQIWQSFHKHAIKPVLSPSLGFYSNLFVIPKKDRGARLVFNLKGLNQFLDASKFKMKTLCKVLGRSSVPVLHNAFWLLHNIMTLHKDHLSGFYLGSCSQNLGSHLTPTQEIDYLGYALDTVSMTVKLLGKKLHDLQKSIHGILLATSHTPRLIHSVAM